MTYESEYGDYTIPEEVLEQICEQGRAVQFSRGAPVE